jgi:hypothetical protein
MNKLFSMVHISKLFLSFIVNTDEEKNSEQHFFWHIELKQQKIPH